MTVKKSNKKYKWILFALGALALVLLLAALIADKQATKSNFDAINEAITNTTQVSAGTATGYTLNYPEQTPDVFIRANRELTFTMKDENYSLLETTTNQATGNIHSSIFSRPGEYYILEGEKWTKQELESDAKVTPYSMTWMITPLTTDQVKSIKKFDRDGQTGYTVSYNRQWMVSSYGGIGTPVGGEITYIVGEYEGKPTLTSMSQKLRAKAKNENGKDEVRVVEEVVYLRPGKMETGQEAEQYLENYYQEKIENNWVPVDTTEETPSEETPNIGASNEGDTQEQKTTEGK